MIHVNECLQRASILQMGITEDWYNDWCTARMAKKFGHEYDDVYRLENTSVSLRFCGLFENTAEAKCHHGETWHQELEDNVELMKIHAHWCIKYCNTDPEHYEHLYSTLSNITKIITTIVMRMKGAGKIKTTKPIKSSSSHKQLNDYWWMLWRRAFSTGMLKFIAWPWMLTSLKASTMCSSWFTSIKPQINEESKNQCPAYSTMW